ncbi:hypothetical protein ACIQAC_18465 [Streptomyces sp. NPDC088387]
MATGDGDRRPATPGDRHAASRLQEADDRFWSDSPDLAVELGTAP